MEVPTEPGQVVAAGQTVVKLARDGAREAEVFLPEGEPAPARRGAASATLYAEGEATYPARLRELSATADPATRTYRARYILSGGGEAAPLGATVTLRLKPAEPAVPHRSRCRSGPCSTRGSGSAVWRYDAATQTVAAAARRRRPPVRGERGGRRRA